jgi:glycosyltransferase involved in cell wall biosynthesis
MSLITVGIPTYNSMPRLVDAVKSILGQTICDFNLHIVDDGSTDGTWDYLRAIEDARVTIYRQDNQGPGAAANRLLNTCQTRYFARMDADDVALPERLAKQVRFMEEHQDVGICGTQISYLIGERVVPAMTFPVTHSAIQSAFTARRFPICNPTMMVRMDVVERVGRYRVARFGGDIDFVIRCSEKAQARNLSEALLLQRLDESCGSYTAGRMQSAAGRWALHCRERRGRGEAELTLSEFLESESQRKWLTGLLDSIQAAGAKQYRRAMIDRGRGMWLHSCLRLALAAGLRPRAVLSRLAEVVQHRLG